MVTRRKKSQTNGSKVKSKGSSNASVESAESSESNGNVLNDTPAKAGGESQSDVDKASGESCELDLDLNPASVNNIILGVPALPSISNEKNSDEGDISISIVPPLKELKVKADDEVSPMETESEVKKEPCDSSQIKKEGKSAGKPKTGVVVQARTSSRQRVPSQKARESYALELLKKRKGATPRKPVDVCDSTVSKEADVVQKGRGQTPKVSSDSDSISSSSSRDDRKKPDEEGISSSSGSSEWERTGAVLETEDANLEAPSQVRWPDSSCAGDSEKEVTSSRVDLDVSDSKVDTCDIPLPPCPPQEDTEKPVKMKSRWRRTSEMEQSHKPTKPEPPVSPSVSPVLCTPSPVPTAPIPEVGSLPSEAPVSKSPIPAPLPPSSPLEVNPPLPDEPMPCSLDSIPLPESHPCPSSSEPVETIPEHASSQPESMEVDEKVPSPVETSRSPSYSPEDSSQSPQTPALDSPVEAPSSPVQDVKTSPTQSDDAGVQASSPPPPPVKSEEVSSEPPPTSSSSSPTPSSPDTKHDPATEERLRNFQVITQSIYLTERHRSKETKRMVCDCSLSKEEISKGEKGCGEDCLNRLLMIECGSRCPLKNLCSNKCFQNCLNSKCDIIRTEKKGWGLVATDDIPSETFIMEYVGEVISMKEFRKRAKEYSKDKNRHYYFMALKADSIIDATAKGNISRFINHSCDPNAETQKWTVNGELRIGFFSRRPIANGEEITFDYQYQRYGKEAQRCYCESSKCRGWIGEEPEEGGVDEPEDDGVDEPEEDAVEEVKEREVKEVTSGKKEPKKERKKKEERRKPVREFFNKELEEEINKLMASGVKNKSHTLTLSRLMVRAEDLTSRTRLLNISQVADSRCLRLFLDYQALPLLWSWMIDPRLQPKHKILLLGTLALLPIQNKTMLKDSKVLSVVEKWAQVGVDSTQPGEPKEEPKEEGSVEEENSSSPNEANQEVKQEAVKEEVEAMKMDDKLVIELSSRLLESWADLKEEFRIPKKQRVEQMKEHEREADMAYMDPDPREALSYTRPIDRGPRKIPRLEDRPPRKARPERQREPKGPKLSKTQRRELFAMKVEKEERAKRDAEKHWSRHQDECRALGLDPRFTPSFAVTPGRPSFYHPSTNSWHSAPPGSAPSPSSGSGPSSGPSPSGPPPVPGSVPPPLLHHRFSSPTTQLPSPLTGLPPLPGFPPPPQSLPYPATPYPPPTQPTAFPPPAFPPHYPYSAYAPLPAYPPPPPPPPVRLPKRWRSAKDKEGRIYYYHVKIRKSQWTFPVVQEGSDSSTDTSSDSDDDEDEDEESSSDEEDKVDPKPEPEPSKITEEEEDEDDYLDSELLASLTNGHVTAPDQSDEKGEEEVQEPESSAPAAKRRREGLVQVTIISPRDDEDDYRQGITKAKIRDNKEKVAKIKVRLKRKNKKSRVSNRESMAKLCEADTSSGPKRRIKDMFRISMSKEVVSALNYYMRSDCKLGRITCSEDFKYLARKLTHFVMLKELRHCVNVEDLECNDNVKHKARDFIKKYMTKFGPVYKRKESADDPFK